MPMAHCDAAHMAAIGWFDEVMGHLVDQLDDALSKSIVKEVHQCAKGVFTDMLGWSRVYSFMKNKLAMPYIEPRLRPSLTGSSENKRGLAELSITQLLSRVLQHSELARKHILESSAKWCSGSLHNVFANELQDITDGDVFRSHPHLAKKAGPDEQHDVRICLYEYTDEFTSVNGLGTKRGLHKYSAHLAAIANLPSRLRFSQDFILPHLLAQYKLVKEHSLARVLCDKDLQGKVHDADCFASEMRALADHGVHVEIPDDLNGGVRCYMIACYPGLT